MSETTRSLYDIIKSAVMDGVLPDDFTLPRDPSVKVPFADGAMDGIGIYHMGAPEITDEIQALIKNAVNAAANENIETTEEAFIALSEKISAVRAIDELQDYIIENRETLSIVNMYNSAVKLALASLNKENVKFGLSILELLNIKNNEELKNAVRTLGLCDEFTLFAVFIMLRWENGNDEIFELAKRVHGWGRIHAVERLEPETDEIKTWLLREGYKNRVMPAYSALTCWNKSGAAELLQSDTELSDEDFRSLRDLIDALLDEGPCAGISAVESSEEMLKLFLNKASGRDLAADDYAVIRNIRNYDGENGNIAALCSEILSTEKCRECVHKAVKNGELIELAAELGMNFKDEVLRLIESDFDERAHLCRCLMGDSEYRAKTIDVFREKLPLEKMKAAPSNELCLGKEFQSEKNLVFLIQELKDHPLEGADLVEASLQCAPIHNRNMALRVLDSWVSITQKSLKELLPEIHPLLKKLLAIEVNDSARETLSKLINE